MTAEWFFRSHGLARLLRAERPPIARRRKSPRSPCAQALLAWFVLSAGAGCSGASGGGSPTAACSFQSATRSGGLCTLSLSCEGAPVGLSCTAAECVCTTGTGNGARFSVDAACGMSNDALTALYTSRCASAARDAGAPARPDVSPSAPAVAGASCTASGEVDLLLVIDNSSGMPTFQRNFYDGLSGFVSALTSSGRVRNLRVGVVSTDLGTGGTSVPSCVESDVGDDGRLNPIRNGDALRAHLPWRQTPAVMRPARCTDEQQFPAFLSHDANGDSAGFAAEIGCVALLGTGGCGLEQPLEAAYRALRVHGTADGPNAGFVRSDSVLAILFLTEEEDGSTRDCRYAEPGDPDGTCAPSGPGSAISVFDSNSTQWASADLNLRFYLYTPGTRNDPTWPITRYVDPQRGGRGFLGLRLGRANQVVVGAITGVPESLVSGDTVNWGQLLGSNPDGSGGYVGTSPQGRVSMRANNPDENCPLRVIPACYPPGANERDSCQAPVPRRSAAPARRLASVVRAMDELNGNGVLGSICPNDQSGVLQRFAARINARLCAP